MSVALEPLLTVQIAVGLVIVDLVVVHLLPRRRVVSGGALSGRLALANALLAALTAARFASGLHD